MLGSRDDLVAEGSAYAIDHSRTTGRRSKHTTFAKSKSGVARHGMFQMHATVHDVFNRGPAAGIRIDHPGLANNTLGEAIERERRDRVDDLVGCPAVDVAPRESRAKLRLHVSHPRLASLEAERAA